MGPLLIGACLALRAGWRPAWIASQEHGNGGAGPLLLPFTPSGTARGRRAGERAGGSDFVARDPLLLVLALMIGAYVGAEVLVGDWAATFLQGTHHLSKVAAATSVSLYWGGLAAGRLFRAC